MNCAPTPTVATATMAAAAIPTAGYTRRRLRVDPMKRVATWIFYGIGTLAVTQFMTPLAAPTGRVTSR